MTHKVATFVCACVAVALVFGIVAELLVFLS